MAEHSPPPAIDGYTYVRHLGSGGFGDVFQYRHATGGSVAVKVLREGAFGDAGREQFEREALALGTLAKDGSHPNIVAVHMVGEAGGRPYLVTDYCPHGSLAQKLAQTSKRLGHNEVMRLGVQIAGALHMAHQAGVVHRDIKPGNILFGVGDVPKLGDFGIAALTAEEVASGSAFLSPDYAAYEVVEWGTADALADIFSLAATLYEALAGHSWLYVPGGDNTDEAMRRRLGSAAVPPIEGCPPQLDRVIRLAMTRDRQVRGSNVATAAEFADRLHTTQIELGYPPTPVPIYEQAPSPTVQRRTAHSSQTAAPASVVAQVAEAPTGWSRREVAPPLPRTMGRPVSVEPELVPDKPSKPKRARWIVVAGAVAVVAGLGALAMMRPASTTTRPTPSAAPGDPGPGALVGAAVPRPVVTAERLDADSVKVTWTYDDPQPGDYFRLQRSDTNAAAQQVDKPEWIADGVTSRLCVTVRVIRADHRAGRDAGEACA